MAGSVFKRCGRTDAAGRPLGPDCPRLRKSDHGSWYYKAELPTGPDGSRHRARKGGFASKRDAQQALVDLLDRVNKRTHHKASERRWAPSCSAGWPARAGCAPRPSGPTRLMSG